MPQESSPAASHWLEEIPVAGIHEDDAHDFVGVRAREQLHVPPAVGVPDHDVGRCVSLRREQRAQFLDDRSWIAGGVCRAARAVAGTGVGEDSGVAGDLTGDLIPVGPVLSQPGLEDDGRACRPFRPLRSPPVGRATISTLAGILLLQAVERAAIERSARCATGKWRVRWARAMWSLLCLRAAPQIRPHSRSGLERKGYIKRSESAEIPNIRRNVRLR